MIVTENKNSNKHNHSHTFELEELRIQMPSQSSNYFLSNQDE